MHNVEKQLSNSLNEKLLFKLEEINSILRERYAYEKNVGVLEGQTGISLFQFYYAKFLDNDKYAQWGLETLMAAMENINQGQHISTYTSGLAGAGWVFEHLYKNDFINIENDELLANIDDYLYECMKKDIDGGYYDFLHGAMGYVYFFLARYTSSQSENLKKDYKAYLEYFVKQLRKCAIVDQNGIRWKSRIISENYSDYGVNLSLSHGISSIVIIVSHILKHNILREDCMFIIKYATKYLLHQEIRLNKDSSMYPSWVIPDCKSPLDSRLAWCYGDLGIGLAFLKASKVVKDDILYSKAMEIFDFSTLRRLAHETSVQDAAICHGAFGLAQIYTYLYHETCNENYFKSSEYWVQYGLDMSIFKDGYAGFKQWFAEKDDWRPTTSLLEGITGIGLAMIDFLSEERNTWDECLLIG